ncbi:hypothetical protein Acy02nite_50100 [Actinoplanes cyaneus]|uniref:Carbohydrate kinase PfkB domain-containing protein n=1 Tax=Actinoplanes cyaneus TaxID=52696 RepID=A0A919M938_9ACTN|nr:PfkB family carbohydrate kinase [Actinoplanes cyaneus]MCW2141067.1 pfkB family carbohydrate kinase [Actinoplanes cyaneus]GID67129.1 hypothetical protein Acy02nite_50100 [Actinoplanes cyaneus]
MKTPVVAVVGQLARDLALSVDVLPSAGSAADATARREQLGGKGANQAVGLVQLGARARLVAVAGRDGVGDRLLDQARRVSTWTRHPGGRPELTAADLRKRVDELAGE